MNVTFENVSSEPYCVYGHFSAGHCFYIGSGCLKRAFTFDKDRSAEHFRKMNSCEMSVTIFSRFKTRKEATDLEREMILVFRPEFNKQHNGPTKVARARKAREKRNPSYKRIKPIKCIETGIYYYSASHAARRMGIHKARITATVVGRCSSADGYHFVQCSIEETGLDPALIMRPKMQP